MSEGKSHLLALALSPISGALRAGVFAKGWEWFVADEFGLPGLSLLTAWGISFLISFLVWFPRTADDSPDGMTGWLQSVLFSVLAFASLLLLVQFR